LWSHFHATGRKIMLEKLLCGAVLMAPLVAPVARAADADLAAKGERTFATCSVCHTAERGGDNGIGPNLWGAYGAHAASNADFSYSSALKSAGIVWNDATLDRWLTAPSAFVPGTLMTFAGVPDPDERKALIAYLKTLREAASSM
jgi:cytochrome c